MNHAQPLALAPSPAIVLAASFAFIIVQLDVSIVNVALPQIGKQLGADISALQWVVDAYTLGFAVLLLAAGAMGDRFGPKRVFLSGLAWFAAASIACALAPTALALNIARACQGIGAALLVPSSLAILNTAYAHDKQQLAKAIGWWTAAGGVSIAAGPVLGGLLVATAGWRSIFWVNVPLCVAGYVLTRAVVPQMRAKVPARSFDVAGQLLSVLTLSAFIGAIIEAQPLGWSHAVVQAGLLCGLICGAAFLLVEHRRAEPMLPLSLFRSRGFSGAVLFGALLNFAYYGVIFVLSFYLQKVRHCSAIQTGVIFLPLTATFIFSNIASGKMSAHSGLRPPMVLGSLIGACGYALLGMLGISHSASVLDMMPGLALIPAGMGLAVPAMTTSILGSVERRLAGTASAVLNAARQVGGAAGVAVFGAMAATGSDEQILSGVLDTLAISAALLTIAAALAYWCKPGQGHKTPR